MLSFVQADLPLAGDGVATPPAWIRTQADLTRAKQAPQNDTLPIAALSSSVLVAEDGVHKQRMQGLLGPLVYSNLTQLAAPIESHIDRQE